MKNNYKNYIVYYWNYEADYECYVEETTKTWCGKARTEREAINKAVKYEQSEGRDLDVLGAKVSSVVPIEDKTRL